MDDEIKVFHRNSTKEHFIAQDHGPRKPSAIADGNHDGTDVGHKLPRAVCERNFAPVELFELKLNSDVLGNAVVHGPCIRQCVGFERHKIRPARIGQPDTCVSQTHVGLKGGERQTTASGTTDNRLYIYAPLISRKDRKV
ncbi:MAG TPA: hypothetical protein VNK48_18135 [Xanthobacteraceae bacterium]|nr:hypothetical protein [Xanthobacteraceae bacterium]